MKGTREHRVTLALKWHHLDNLSPAEIVDRFEEQGFGSPARSTIRDYLSEAPREEIVEQIEQKHADVRLQIAEREEALAERARTAEFEATRDEPKVRVVPKTETVPGDRETPLPRPDWEVVDDPADRPDWATERDVIIRFTGKQRSVHPGEEYPLRALDGTPRYTKEFDGLERDQPDQQQRSALRREQSQHLEAKGEVLGVYEETLNVQGEIETDLSLSSEEKAQLNELFAEDDGVTES